MNWNQIEGKWKRLKGEVNEKRMSITLIFLILVGAMAVQPVANAQSDPSVEGQWSNVISWPHEAIHMHVLPNGKVMTWPRDASGNPSIWDPDSGTFTLAPPAGFNIFCSGHTFLPNGRLFITGGDMENAPLGTGVPKAIVYRPWRNLWKPAPDMNANRWYPTNTTLSNGNVLVVAGFIDPDVKNDLPQVFQLSTGSWQDLTNARLVLLQSVTDYVWMHLAPNGKVFNSGPDRITRYLDTTNGGKWTEVATRQFGYRGSGSSVMYDDGKVLVIGGGNPPTATAEVIDLNASFPAWRYVGSMSIQRRNLNATLLPDGKVLVTGGNFNKVFGDLSTAVYSAEMWDPATEQFSTMASMAKRRMYHSTAVLLPDGRVLSAGGDKTVGGDPEPTAEIYSPPYLFQGARPKIASAPSSVKHGQTFFLETPDAANIAQVTWIRLPSVTHAFNQNQRINRLIFSQAADGLNVTAPSNRNLSPPGHYMLFILNGNSVPSVAKIIKLK